MKKQDKACDERGGMMKRRKGRVDDGFMLCFVLNLLFNYWWGAIALILFGLYLWLKVPLYLSLIALLIWYGVAFVSTWLVVLAAGSPARSATQLENRNPYSAKNPDYSGKNKENPTSGRSFDASAVGLSVNANPVSAQTAIKTAKPSVDAGKHWLKSANDLRQAMLLIGISGI